MTEAPAPGPNLPAARARDIPAPILALITGYDWSAGPAVCAVYLPADGPPTQAARTAVFPVPDGTWDAPRPVDSMFMLAGALAALGCPPGFGEILGWVLCFTHDGTPVAVAYDPHTGLQLVTRPDGTPPGPDAVAEGAKAIRGLAAVADAYARHRPTAPQ